MVHPDFNPVFVSSPNISYLWNSYQRKSKLSFDIFSVFKKCTLHDQYNNYARVKPQKTLNKIVEAFTFSDVFIDYNKYNLLIQQGIVWNYFDNSVDVAVISKFNKIYYIKINRYPYCRNSTLIAYFTTEFIENVPNVYKKLHTELIGKVEIRIVSRNELNKILCNG